MRRRKRERALTAGRLAVTLGALAGVGLVLVEETLQLRPAMFVAVGLATVLTIVVVVVGVEARRSSRERRERDW